MNPQRPEIRDDFLLPHRVVIPVALVALVVFVAFIGLKTNNMLVLGGLMLAPLVVLLINFPATYLVTILGLYRSGLIFPGIPQGLQVVHVMMFGFALLVLANQIILKIRRKPLGWSGAFLWAFLVVMGITAYVRGVGIRYLGSDLWGGMAYVKIVVAATFMLSAKYVPLSRLQMKRSVYLMLALSLLPAAAQLLFQLSGGSIYQQYAFVEAYYSGLIGSLQAESQGGVVRYYTLAGVGSTLTMLALVLIPSKRSFTPALMLTLIVALALNAFSGYRSSLFATMCTVCIFFILISPKRAVSRLSVIGTGVLLTVLMLIPISPYLPGAIQRSLTWIPFMQIPDWIRLDADFSTLWRVEVWKMAWAEVPDYLWIGKGFAMQSADVMSYSARFNNVLGAFLGHNYHNGPLTLLLDLGIPGLITGGGFLIVSTIEELRLRHTLPKDELTRKFYIFFLSSYLYSVFNFFFLFGDKESIAAAFIMVGILQCIRVSARAQDEAPKKAAAAGLSPRPRAEARFRPGRKLPKVDMLPP